jgi:hypothetical protein
MKTAAHILTFCLALILTVSMVSTFLSACSSSTTVDCPDGEVVDGVCRPRDCPDFSCPPGHICAVDKCVDLACLDKNCGQGQVCVGGVCYSKDCVWRTCPGLGEVCIDEECQQANCVDVDCGQNQRCASGACYPIDCQTKKCPGYTEVCIEDECVERSCAGIDCQEDELCAGGYCYPAGCATGECFNEGEVCIDGVCQRRACIGVECEVGRLCANGWCYPVDCGAFTCSDFGEVCYQDTCIHVACVGIDCPAGQRCSRGECFDVACADQPCEAWEVCFQGRCLRQNCVGLQCPPGQTCADGECLPADCTEDEIGCGTGEVCQAGACIPLDCAHIQCDAGQICAADLNCYPADCGATQCGTYEVCVNDVCVDRMCLDVDCPQDQICAAGNCYEPDCETPCANGQICEDGECIAVECAGGRCCPATICTLGSQCQTEECSGVTYTCLFNDEQGLAVWGESGSSCNDQDPCTLNDSCSQATCQGTPVACDSGEICVLGLCYCGGTGPDCENGDSCCGVECFDTDTNMTHCGGCESPCQREHATAQCSAGACHIDSCDQHWDNCNLDDSDGCETSLETVDDCSACDQSCSRANATASCPEGNCQIGSCDSLWGDCDLVDANGCETQTTSLSDCGDCAVACALDHAGEDCSSGVCRITSCDNLYDDCNSTDSDGCEASLESLAHCTACFVECSRSHATATCAGGNCRIDSCNSNYYDINGTDSDGCECGDTSDAPGACSSANNIGTLNNSNRAINASGVLVHKTGLRTEQDCFRVTFSSPNPGLATFRARFNPARSNLVLEAFRNNCSTQECGGESEHESHCSSSGSTCQTGNNNDWIICVRAAAGQNNLCQSYTLQLQYIP